MEITMTTKTSVEVHRTITGKAFKVKNRWSAAYYIPIELEGRKCFLFCSEHMQMIVESPADGDELEACQYQEAFELADAVSHTFAKAVHVAFVQKEEE